MIRFFMDMVPPTATHQQKKAKVVNGKVRFYEPDNLKAARALLSAGLWKHRPKEPLEGAVQLKVGWFFPTSTRHKAGEWKTTRPDTDNMIKLLKDCMTDLGYWHDDAQVTYEVCIKAYADRPGIFIAAREITAEEIIEQGSII